MNKFDENDRLNLLFQSCVAATAEHFSHLPVASIVNPPHHWFDAALARQIVFHMMAGSFGVPRRRLSDNFERGREAISRGMSVIDNRLDCDEFSNVYGIILTRAESHYTQQLEDAA